MHRLVVAEAGHIGLLADGGQLTDIGHPTDADEGVHLLHAVLVDVRPGVETRLGGPLDDGALDSLVPEVDDRVGALVVHGVDERLHHRGGHIDRVDEAGLARLKSHRMLDQ